MRGSKIGKVKFVQPFKDLYKIEIQTNGYKIKSGDGLKFICGTNQQSVGVGNVDYHNGNFVIYSKTRPNVNDIVNLTLDSENENKLIEVNIRKILYKSLEKEFSGNTEKLLKAIFYSSINPAEWFATRLRDSLKGAGTKDKQLIRIIVSRADMDLREIKQAY